jgi:hypothetical protein
MSVQAPSAVILVRPAHFTPNGATAIDNAFQSVDATRTASQIARDAWLEVTRVAEALETAGVTVHLFDDEETTRPDSVFPNNWISTHQGGRLAIYPMFSPSRRSERRTDIIEELKREYRVQDLIDYSGLEYDNIFLEGTGAMVLDHSNRLAYVARSHRADPLALERFCTHFGYEPMAFDATDASGVAVYHTNVMMCIATDFAMIGLDMIRDAGRRAEVAERLTAPGRALIDLSHDQVASFTGNAIELQGRDGRILTLSTRANASLTSEQRAIIEGSCSILAVDVPTIELAGGSVRCMIAGIHLDRRPKRAQTSGVGRSITAAN